MSRENNKTASADEVAERAEDLEAVGGVVGDLAAVLLVLGPSEEDNTLDLLADGGTAVSDGCTSEGSTLAIMIRHC